MKNNLYSLALLGSLLLVASPAAPADNDKPKRPEEAKREMLSRHETIAEFQGLEFHLCRGRTARCPEECGDSGEFATFRIVKYLKYEKPGKYGDPKRESYRMQVTDFHRKPLAGEFARRAGELKKGDKVLLTWRHDYVTTKGGSRFPDRTVTKIQKIEEE